MPVHILDIGTDIMDEIWCISFFAALTLSAYGAIFWRLILNIHPIDLFLNWMLVMFASTFCNAIVSFPMRDEGFFFVVFLPLIGFGWRVFDSLDEKDPMVFWVAATVCIMVCALFPFLMPCFIKKAVMEYGFIFYQIILFVAASGVIYACGAIHYMRLARKSMYT